MQKLKSKTMAILIAAILTFSMTSMMLIPTVHAPLIGDIHIYAYINAEPNPCGVNQQIEIIMWVQDVFGANAMLTNTYRFSNYTLVITAPSGVNTTVVTGAVQSPTSDFNYFYTPITTGQYMFTFMFPATNVTAANDPTSSLIGDEYLPAQASTNVTVQSTAIAAPPSTPLPTSFWTRPIYGENTAWYVLGSNWLGDSYPGYVAPDTPNEKFGPTTQVGSLTAHIMWTLPIAPGGVVGQTPTGESTSSTTLETIPGNSYADGSAYDQKFTNPIIVDGLLIFTLPVSQTGVVGGLGASVHYGATVCYNLVTGQLVWNESIPAMSYAYVYDPEDPNQHGVWPPMIISGTSWYDAFTGDFLFTSVGFGGLGGTSMAGPAGEILDVTLHNYGNTTVPNWYLVEWNSSRMWDNLYSGASTTPTLPPPDNGTTIAVVKGVQQYVCDDFNVSVPWLNTATGPTGALITSITIQGAIQNDMLLCRVGALSSGGIQASPTPSQTPWEWIGIGLNATGAAYVLPGTGGDTSAVGSVNLGNNLWHNIVQPPPDNLTEEFEGIDPVSNAFVIEYFETLQFNGFSLLTGQQIWGPTTPQASLDYYGSTGPGSLCSAVAYGNSYSCAYAGIVYCYNDATGKILFTYGNGPPGSDNSTNAGIETPFGDYPTFIMAIGNGVVYMVTTEHTQETPIFKGGEATAINATTGALIWQVSDFTGQFGASSYCMADGYNVFFNSYNNEVYCVGQGSSVTTVTAPQTAITVGTPVVIEGTVTDTSPGTQQFQQKADFPLGVPCSSDASMTQWMEYVYDQQPEPTNFIGVTVTLTAIDPNHNLVTLGEANTTDTGLYTLTWTPPSVTGNYLITATFCGNNGYFGSSEQTGMVVQNAPATAAPYPTPVTGLASFASLELGIAAVIIVIIIIGVVLAILMLRKRP